MTANLGDEVEGAIKAYGEARAEMREPHNTRLDKCVPNLEAALEALRAAITRRVEEEREACAKVCEALSSQYPWGNLKMPDAMRAECATAIRARGGV